MKRFIKVCLVICIASLVVGGGLTAAGAAMGGSVSHLALPRELSEGVSDGLGGLKEGIREMKNSIKEELEGEWWFHWDSDEDSDLSAEAIPSSQDKGENDGGTAMAGQDVNEPGENTVQFPKESVRELNLEVKRGRAVILTDSDSDVITVSGNGNQAMEAYADKEGELKVTVGPDQWWLNKNSDQLSVYIHVPKGFRFDQVELQSKVGKGSMYKKNCYIKSDGLLADRLELKADVGAIFITGADAGTLDVSCDVGDVQYEGSVSKAVKADCDVGAINLKIAGESKDFNYDMKCDVGSISLDGSVFAGLSGRKSVDNGAAKKMKLECDTGSIKVNFK